MQPSDHALPASGRWSAGALGSAPQCNLAETGMTGDRDFLRVKQAEGQQEAADNGKTPPCAGK